LYKLHSERQTDSELLRACELEVEETWELMFMFFNVLEHVVVGVGDDKALAEDVDDGSDVEVLRSVVGR